jgi:hypothetical protein
MPDEALCEGLVASDPSRCRCSAEHVEEVSDMPSTDAGSVSSWEPV